MLFDYVLDDVEHMRRQSQEPDLLGLWDLLVHVLEALLQLYEIA